MQNRIEVKYTGGEYADGTAGRRFLDTVSGQLFSAIDGRRPVLPSTFHEEQPGVWRGECGNTVTDILYLCSCAKNSIHECPAACPVPGAQCIKNLHLAENAVLGVPSTEAKRDTGKPRFDLLEDGCPDALLDVVKVMTWAVEVKGYRAHSWREVPEARRRYRAAMSRHRNALARGELLDEESGLPHEAHIACNAIFLAQLLYVQPE